MAHLPVNHRLAGFYRFLAGMTGVYLLTYGIVGVVETWGEDLFERGPTEALGLPTNLAFSLLSVLVGLVVVGGAVIGRNLDHYINYFGGMVFWLSGLVMLLVMQTDANLLNFTITKCIVSFLIGTVLVLAGMYGKRGTPDQAKAEETFRHSSRDIAVTGEIRTPGHVLSAHPGVRHRENHTGFRRREK